MKETVGFVGLGNMGLPMAQNLLKAGYSLQVFNRTSSKAESLLQQGASRAFSPRAVAEQVTVVISMVADDEALEAVALGEEGILAGLALGGIHVDISTVFPDTSKKLSELYPERGVHFVAAPVFGTLEMAAAARLFICPAGPAEIIDRCRPLFDAMGQVFIVAVEEPHLANVLKLVGNFFLMSLNETFSEAFTWQRKLVWRVSKSLNWSNYFCLVPLPRGMLLVSPDMNSPYQTSPLGWRSRTSVIREGWLIKWLRLYRWQIWAIAICLQLWLADVGSWTRRHW